ncbi:Pre-rRNA-processing protein ipi3 [Orbilia oligospora]|uniref:Pre-rRNA-processing protein IPI3 n=1 Tax=Orbilia oligospora TaxID=2813651 RepID=A0A7C8UGN4_ORBOL|nr:Pre-rRNA-processing protein ipi3 [Orbilia oligospora]
MTLTELVAISSHPPSSSGASASPEAYISLHDLHSFTQTSTFKKSCTPSNSLAISPTHIFAAQSDKTVLNVYNRTKNSLETTVPLPEQLTAVTCSSNGGIVAMGTASGRVNIWEVEFSKVGNRTVELGNGTTSPAESSSGGDGERSYDSPLYRADERHIPIATSGNGSKWTAEGHDTAVTTMDVVFQGNYLVAGTESGSVNVWDAATGQLFRTLTTYKAPISNVKILPPTGFSEDTVTTSQLTIIPPRYHEAVKASSGNQVDVDTTLPPMSLQFHNTLNPTPDPFSPASDLDAIKRGIAYFNSPAIANSTNSVKGDQITITEFKSSEDAEKIETLEKELATMKERYKRLNEVHKQTWEEHTKWVMEVDKEKAEKMKEMGPEGMEE